MADIAELARHLNRQAEAVCRHYLSRGRRNGRYWLVGDVHNSPGRSLFVRLTGPDCGKGAAGKWTDAATGDHGDLLDVIRQSCGLADVKAAAAEAHRFLSLPQPAFERTPRSHPPPAQSGSPEAARRLFATAQPLRGTVAETYLRGRGIAIFDMPSLRLHPRCLYRTDESAPPERWPAMIAAVTDLDGAITGAHRTWLNPDGSGKAPVDSPRRAMGDLLGHAVRFGAADDVLAAGEGIETMLSLRSVLPQLPVAAALSASHLGALRFHTDLRRLYIARDDDPAGDRASRILTERAQAAGIEGIVLQPRRADFNDDLRLNGVEALRAALRVQIAPEDVARFMPRRT